jgi:septal ring factor EnvC (AmiA/AmiB activator)
VETAPNVLPKALAEALRLRTFTPQQVQEIFPLGLEAVVSGLRLLCEQVRAVTEEISELRSKVRRQSKQMRDLNTQLASPEKQFASLNQQLAEGWAPGLPNRILLPTPLLA